ncbi:MAG: hypothetical protein ACYTDY_13205, partial [Planctomycetota bacterium]
AESGEYRDSLRLSTLLKARDAPAPYGPASDGLTVKMGGATLLSLPPVPEGARLRAGRKGRWRYREKGRARLRLNVRKGRLDLRIRGEDLSSILAGGSDEIPVVVVMGEVTFSQSIDLEDQRNSWTYRSEGIPFFTPFGPGDPGDPDDPGPADGVTFRRLIAGAAGDVQTPQTQVFRTKAAYEDFWFKHPGMWPLLGGGGGAPIVPPPVVDFDKEMVLGVFLGVGPWASVAVDVIEVKDSGTGYTATYQEEVPGPNCPQPMLSGGPFVLVAVPKVTGPVSFVRTVWVKNCN